MQAPRNRLRVGIAGVGRMGLRHVAAVLGREDVDLLAIADPSDEALAAAMALARATGRGKQLRPHHDARAMLAAEYLDCVIVATPPDLHTPHCVTAAGRGAAVLVEKPLAATTAQGQEIVNAAAEHGTLVMVGHIERFNPVVDALRGYVHGGLIGEPLTVDARRFNPRPHAGRNDSAALDLAVHDVDLVRHVLGVEIERVSAETRPTVDVPLEDRIDATLRLSSRAGARLAAGWQSGERDRRIVIVGDSGTVEVDLVAQTLRSCVTADEQWREESFPGEPIVREHDAFFEAVWNGGPSPVSGDDGLRALIVVDALLESAALGHPVALPVPHRPPPPLNP
jgi:UDP-N-acetylglucosamine 3-dehydrogenase